MHLTNPTGTATQTYVARNRTHARRIARQLFGRSAVWYPDGTVLGHGGVHVATITIEA